MEFVPKTLADLHVEGSLGSSDAVNGGNYSLYGKTHTLNTTVVARGLVAVCFLSSLPSDTRPCQRWHTWHFSLQTNVLIFSKPPRISSVTTFARTLTFPSTRSFILTYQIFHSREIENPFSTSKLKIAFLQLFLIVLKKKRKQVINLLKIVFA